MAHIFKTLGVAALVVLIALIATDYKTQKAFLQENQALFQRNTESKRTAVELRTKLTTLTRQNARISPTPELLELRNVVGSLRNVEAELAQWKKQQAVFIEETATSEKATSEVKTATSKMAKPESPTPQVASPQLYTKSFKIPNPATFQETLELVTGGNSGVSATNMLNALLAGRNTHLDALFYNHRTGTLLARGELQQLVDVESLIDSINTGRFTVR